MVNPDLLVAWLRRADQLVPVGRLPIARISLNDGRFDWSALPPCGDGGFPGIYVGQERDCRYPTDGNEGLHAQVFSAGFVDFHLDRQDACRHPFAHAAADTKALAGAFLAGLAGAAAAAMIGDGARGVRGAAAGAPMGGMIGATIGGAIGLSIPDRWRRVFSLDELAALVRA